MLDVVTATYENINENQYTGLIFVDLKKAFDTVCHPILLSKLAIYGIRGTANKLVQSYLTKRQQYMFTLINANLN